MDQLLFRLVFQVGNIVTPRVVHRFAGFQREFAYCGVAGEAGGILSRQILLESLCILPLLRCKVVVADDQTARLDAVDMVVDLTQAPVEIGRLIPLPVKPDRSDLTVIGQQFGQLVQHKPVVRVPITLFGSTDAAAGPSKREIVGPSPVELGVVEMELDSLLVALIGKLLDDIALEWRTVNNVV